MPKDNDDRFYHGRKNDRSFISVQDEFHCIVEHVVNNRKNVVHGYFQLQCLKKHVTDLSDPAIDSSNILFPQKPDQMTMKMLTPRTLIILRNLSV
ncbi:hypothetical protein TNCT_464781 [Trichonephila clavata]|uniref:Uncharacterized protein n=1 Tax=Trichonephila clavata TaxID=2740835 RepID=A0A8X6FD63_TRICU|nr:hypothetical protein TNCT_464781 [Trichonephila clavata]